MRTIAIVNQKGGCGKTTTSINLAATLAARGLRTLLVDMDPQSHCAAGLGVPEDRIETGIAEGRDVTPYYDPLLAKVVAHGPTRDAAIARLERALAETTIELVAPTGAPAATNLAFLRKVLASPAFREGRYDTSFAEALAKEK